MRPHVHNCLLALTVNLLPQLFFIYLNVDCFLPAAEGSGFWHPETSRCSQGEERPAACTLTEPATALKQRYTKSLTAQPDITKGMGVCMCHLIMCKQVCVCRLCNSAALFTSFLWTRSRWFDSPTSSTRHHDVLYAAPPAEEPGPELLWGRGQGKRNWNQEVKKYGIRTRNVAVGLYDKFEMYCASFYTNCYWISHVAFKYSSVAWNNCCRYNIILKGSHIKLLQQWTHTVILSHGEPFS